MAEKIRKLKDAMNGGIERIKDWLKRKPLDNGDPIAGFVLEENGRTVWKYPVSIGADGKPRKIGIGIDTGIKPNDAEKIAQLRQQEIEKGLRDMESEINRAA